MGQNNNFRQSVFVQLFVASFVIAFFMVSPVRAAGGEGAGQKPDISIPSAPQMQAPKERLLQLASSGYSCAVRRTCKQIATCTEAYWYLRNCSWGGRLDRDKDGVPCESGPC